MDSEIGIFAADPDSYRTFRPLFHPIICSVQTASPETKQPGSDWSDPDHLMCHEMPGVLQVAVLLLLLVLLEC